MRCHRPLSGKAVRSHSITLHNFTDCRAGPKALRHDPRLDLTRAMSLNLTRRLTSCEKLHLRTSPHPTFLWHGNDIHHFLSKNHAAVCNGDRNLFNLRPPGFDDCRRSQQLRLQQPFDPTP